MVTRHEALTALLAKVEAGGNPTQAAWFAVFPDLPTDDDYPRSLMAVNAAVGWIDAAKALHEAVLIGFEWLVREDDTNGGFANVMTHDFAWHAEHDGTNKLKNVVDLGAAFHAYSSTPARAWLIAILKALIAMEEDHA